MINDGVTKGLNRIIGVHVYPDLPVGKIGIKEEAFAAAELSVEINGTWSWRQTSSRS